MAKCLFRAERLEGDHRAMIRPFHYLGSSMATVFGIPVFEMSKASWYYRPIMLIYRWAYAVQRTRFRFVLRFVRRDHILRLPTAGQWCETDDQIFLACFELLGRYVEQQLGLPGLEEGYRGYRLHSAGGTDEQAIDLWLWYKTDLPALERDYHDDLQRCYSGEWKTKPAGNGLIEIVDFGRVAEPKYPHDWPGTVKNEKLLALMELRRTLWT